MTRKSTAPEGALDAKFLTKVRKLLVDKRRALLHRRDGHVADERQLMSEQEADWEDAAANKTTVDMLDHLGEMERAELNRLAAAIERLDKGTYGDCVSCGEGIAAGRLEAMPEATQCTPCAAAAHKR